MTPKMESSDLIMKVSLTNCECFVQQVRSSGSPLWQFCELHKAAPELLELLKDVGTWLETHLELGHINAGTANRNGDLVSQIRAVIAKAEGK